MFSHLHIDVTFQDLARQIKTSGNRPEMLKAAQKILDKVNNTWNPSVVYCWCEIQPGKPDTIGTIQNSSNLVDIDFGYAIKFLTHADHALVSVYTAGNELENKYQLTYGFNALESHSPKKMINKIKELLNNPNLKNEWGQKKERMLLDKINLNNWMVNFFNYHILGYTK